MRSVVVLLLAAGVVVAWLGVRATGLVPGLQVGGSLYWVYLALFELPLLVLLWRQLARAGAQSMAQTAGATLTCLAGLLPITVVVTLFAGFAMSIEQLYWLFYLWGFLALLFVTGAAALIGYRIVRQPAVPAGWAGAIYVPLLYVIAAHGIAIFVGQYEVASQHSAQDNQYKAKDALRKINQCASLAAARAGAKGYPLALAELGPGGTGCLDAALASGKLRGYAIDYQPGLPDEAGRIAIYTTCAMPTEYPRGGGLTLASHEDTDSVAENGDPKLTVPMSCDRAWHYYPGSIASLQNLKACVIRYARERPLEGYPASLSELRGYGCDVPGQGLKYSVAEAAQKPRKRFAGAIGGSVQGYYGSFFIDQTGVVRFERKGDAGAASTPFREILADAAAAQERQREQRAAAGKEAFAACEKGDASACDRYAEHALYDLNKSDEAQVYFKRACDGGHQPGCVSVFAAGAPGSEAFHASMWFRKLCRDGNPRACEALTRIPAGASRDDIRKIEEWVRQHAA